MTGRKFLSRSAYLKFLSLLFVMTTLTPFVLTQALPHRTNSAYAAASVSPAARFRQQPSASFASTASSKLPKFVAHRDFAVADGPQSIAMADLNGDGIFDLVLDNSHSSGITVLLGNRNGTFRPFTIADCGCTFSFDVVLADLNADGKIDAAVASPDGVSILLGDGAGNFGAPQVLPAGISPERIVAADLNGDHKLDLAVTNIGSNTVSIFLGHGDGTFASATDIPVGMGPDGISVGDFNHDGKLDLAVADSGEAFGNNKGPNANTVAILLGNGRGGVSSTTFIPVEKTPQSVLVHDFNNDNKLDLVVTSLGKGDVSELLGNGNGTFQAARIFHVGARTDSIRTADLNADGHDDLLVTNGTLSSVSILFGDGTGNFGPAITEPSGRTVSALATGDFNHDGKMDYLTANFDSNTVSVILGKGNGTFVDLGPALPIATDLPEQTITADFNGDGLPDLALVDTGLNQAGHTVEILLGKSGGGFGPAKAFAAGIKPQDLVATDFNHDGHTDLLVADVGSGSDTADGVSLLLGNGDGTFQSPRRFDAGGSPIGIATGDFNGDRNPDVVVVDGASAFGEPLIELLLGNGNNGLGPAKTVTVLPSFTQIQHILSGDFNHDGKQDIAYISSLNDNRVSVQFGNGDGTFQPPVVVVSRDLASTIFFAFATGDFNNDGIPDFAVEEGGFLEIVLNDGHGNFTSAGQFSEDSGAVFGFASALLVADFNGDGILDVAVPDGFAETIAVLLGNGDGTLGPATLFGGGLADSATTVNLAGFQPSIVLATSKQVLEVKNTTAAQ